MRLLVPTNGITVTTVANRDHSHCEPTACVQCQAVLQEVGWEWRDVPDEHETPETPPAPPQVVEPRKPRAPRKTDLVE